MQVRSGEHAYAVTAPNVASATCYLLMHPPLPVPLSACLGHHRWHGCRVCLLPLPLTGLRIGATRRAHASTHGTRCLSCFGESYTRRLRKCLLYSRRRDFPHWVRPCRTGARTNPEPESRAIRVARSLGCGALSPCSNTSPLPAVAGVCRCRCGRPRRPRRMTGASPRRWVTTPAPLRELWPQTFGRTSDLRKVSPGDCTSRPLRSAWGLYQVRRRHRRRTTGVSSCIVPSCASIDTRVTLVRPEPTRLSAPSAK